MTQWTTASYGDAIADVYDELYGNLDPTDAVALVADLSNGGRVLELAIGTGRLALPLAARGVSVYGIDASAAMLERLRSKPGADAIAATCGDFADVAVDGPFGAIFVAFNTFFALATQAEQLRCFRNVANKLAPSGVFVIEAFVPDPTRFVQGQRLQTIEVDIDHVIIEASQHDRASQTINTQIILQRATGNKLMPIRLRYAWPSELDLMAKLAGLRLRDRWSNWRRGPFSSLSGMHVSVYEREASEPHV